MNKELVVIINGAGTNGMELKALYKKLAEEHGSDKAAMMVAKDPSRLGAFRGYGIGRLVGFGEARKDVIALCQNLEKQLEAYNKSGDLAKTYNDQMQKEDFDNKYNIDKIVISESFSIFTYNDGKKSIRFLNINKESKRLYD